MNPAQIILIGFIKLYRWVISPAKTVLFGPLGRCRFTPSCSQYALQAIAGHGALPGSWLALKRLSRCHPWGGCGHDPVPRSRHRPNSDWAEIRKKFEIRAPRLNRAGYRVSGRIGAIDKCVPTPSDSGRPGLGLDGRSARQF